LSKLYFIKVASNIQPLQNNAVVKFLNAEKPGYGQQWAVHWITRGLGDLEEMVSRTTGGKYAVGDQISIADICIPSILYNAKRFGIDVSAYPKLCMIDANTAKIPEFQAAHPDRQPDANPEAK
uniref:GST C-terminal domain-containing protein n=1 Tax=Haemonchus placei TaxID=6290 RepID=A0A0N4WUQ4_HAEPC